jgi:hypothetical protein
MPKISSATTSRGVSEGWTHLSDRSGLVVPSDELDAIWISELEAGEEGDGLDAKEASIDVIPWGGSRD